MSLISLKRDAMRIRRIAGIDLDFIDYEAAICRHVARLDILIADKIVPTFERTNSSRRPNAPAVLNNKASKIELLSKADAAKKLLGDDTPELWKKDQDTIESYKYGGPPFGARTESSPPFGGTPKEMFDHYLRYEKAKRKNAFYEG